MCGLTGFIHLGIEKDLLLPRLTSMLQTIFHRGPDEGGSWVDQNNGLALGHRRLSILDLSSAGHQPMESHCGRYVIVYNGEIYNHLELRNRLEDSNSSPVSGWRGHSDTETLLRSISVWGIEKTLEQAVGMFALALWDKEERTLTLARDRIGEKPLYYSLQRGVFLFGSELKALRSNPSFRDEVNWRAAADYLCLNYIPAPSTIYQEVYKLIPGTVLRVSLKDIEKNFLPQPKAYWSLGESALKGQNEPFKGSFHDAIEELELLIKNAVQLQSISDVPVGAFLSGGIDSSLVVAMMKSAKGSKVSTFSIGMPEAKMDESQHAARVAKYLGTNHHEHFLKINDVVDIIPRLNEIWDEPFGDSSQIPTFLVSQLAKKKVTVALSGDGGDEFFLGYHHYSFYQKLWKTRYLGKLPWETSFNLLSPLEKNKFFSKKLSRAKSLVGAWRQPNGQSLNRYWTNRYRQGEFLLKGNTKGIGLEFPVLNDVASSAALWDAGTYLPDDILVKVDRASMAASLETRAPLLDHRVIEFSLRLPVEYKLDGEIGKKVLREVLYRHVPKEIVDRPKMGFSIPISRLLTNELRPWVEDMLSKVSHHSDQLNKVKIDLLWKEHLAEQADHSEKLWTLLNLLGFLK